MFGSMLFMFFILSAGLVSCAGPKTTDSVASLSPTLYFKPTIHRDKAKCSSSAERELVSPEGLVLTRLCESDYKQCLLQGSCFVEDEAGLTSYNYHSTKGGVARFIITDLKSCPYGYGVKSSCLDPFFSVAADLRIYEFGDVIFVPRLVGVKMPTGEIHDGFLVIRDTGRAIVGAQRFDFFTGFLSHRDRQNPLAQLGFADPQKRFEFRKASAAEAQIVRTRRGFPGLKRAFVGAF